MDRDPIIQKFPMKLLAKTPWWIVQVTGTVEETNQVDIPRLVWGRCCFARSTMDPLYAMMKRNIFPLFICAVLSGTYKSKQPSALAANLSRSFFFSFHHKKKLFIISVRGTNNFISDCCSGNNLRKSFNPLSNPKTRGNFLSDLIVFPAASKY